jgi:hypothetical protein
MFLVLISIHVLFSDLVPMCVPYLCSSFCVYVLLISVVSIFSVFMFVHHFCFHVCTSFLFSCLYIIFVFMFVHHFCFYIFFYFPCFRVSIQCRLCKVYFAQAHGHRTYVQKSSTINRNICRSEKVYIITVCVPKNL